MTPIKKIYIFSSITLLIGFLTWGMIAIFQWPVSSLETQTSSHPMVMMLFVINGFVPSIVGLILILTTEKGETPSTLSTLLPSKHQLGATTRIFILFLVCFIAQIILYEWIIGGFEYETMWQNLYQVIPLIILGPLSEEIGWRGYLQKAVSKVTTPVKGTMIIALIWALWHLPLFYIVGTTQQANGVSFLTFTVLIVLVSWIMTYYYETQQGSLFLSIFVHWIYTVVMSFFIISTVYSITADIIAIIPIAVLSIVLYFQYRKQSLIKSET